MDLLDKSNKHWGWSGLNAVQIVGRNEFGNILAGDKTGAYWRICPEELTCEVVARSPEEFARLLKKQEFQSDWQMHDLVKQARKKLGNLKDEWVYYLVIPSVFGGEYDASNMQTVPFEELIGLSGDWARSVAGLPDGTRVRIQIED